MRARLKDGPEGRGYSPSPRRLSRDRSHGRVYKFWDKLPAWRTLTSRGRDLVMFVLRAYHPDHPNAFELTDSTIAALIGCSENTARKVFRECVERGWFVLEREGCMRGALCSRGRVVSLACYETPTRRAEPKRYEDWRPKEFQTVQKLPLCLTPFDGERRKKSRRTPQKLRSSIQGGGGG